MREIRINPIVPTESVLVATERGSRPRPAETQPPMDQRDHVDSCPFCRGNESLTPPTLVAYPDEANWEIRVVRNLYPLLGQDSDGGLISIGLQKVIDGYGRHEVFIDHYRHGISLHEMGESHIALLFRAYRARMQELYQGDDRLQYVLVFKNFGPAAGASMAHTHSQIIATPVVPENILNEVEHSHRYYREKNQCIFCNLLDEALDFEATIYDSQSNQVRRTISNGQYVIEKGKRFVAIKPFASRFEWEIHIFPLAHQSDFVATSDEDLDDLATVLRRTMARLHKVLGYVQYNYFLHSLPHGMGHAAHDRSYHWHLEICPRTTIPNGFELGSGLFVSTISPEETAARLRAVAP